MTTAALDVTGLYVDANRQPIVQHRAAQAEVVDIDPDQGTVQAQLMTYEREAEIADGLWEVFSAGAFSAACGNPSRIKVSNQGHDRATLIGHATHLEERDGRLLGTLAIDDTTHGRDVLTMLRSGTLTDLSVEFRVKSGGYRVAQRRDGGVLVRHDRAVLVGVSPVGIGAYGDGSKVLSVRDLATDRAREAALAHLHQLTAGAHRA